MEDCESVIRWKLQGSSLMACAMPWSSPWGAVPGLWEAANGLPSSLTTAAATVLPLPEASQANVGIWLGRKHVSSGYCPVIE